MAERRAKNEAKSERGKGQKVKKKEGKRCKRDTRVQDAKRENEAAKERRSRKRKPDLRKMSRETLRKTRRET